MLKIILCDDDPFILRLGAEKISDLIASQGFDAKVVSLASGSQELFSYVKKNPSQYLVFLDLDFGNGKLNGIDVAKALRRTGSDCKVVFATNHQEMAMDVLKSGVEPFGFLEKTSDISKLADGYRRYIAMLSRQAGTGNRAGAEDSRAVISLNPGMDEEISVFLEDIVYLETEKSVSHGITYHTINGSVITIIGVLDEEQKKLGGDFIRVHRSYLVNKRHILRMKDGFLKLSDQREVPCSFRMRGEVRKWIV
ncbi:MAG: LytTR family DNA-binding domain-containing protein [Eubacterium sp.]|nr:LytTR family DNA-binding domain-containing protein [Eubacterium sp.]MCM1304792.1 LytTR family DNA-binding domain-containing protein [Butyrivibrio sp.]MCM1344541.1 LytTR family DNA-binding domain-containing protein [Muribaculaceae bacterium]MCM1411851.1 LytTR family DNA-binding domain-containing protein [Lachnospiraceae bacterium]